MLLCDSDDDEDIVLNESDTDEDERISEIDDSESKRGQQAIQKMKIMTTYLQMPLYSALRNTETSSSHGDGEETFRKCGRVNRNKSRI
ncbi:hypothetical protein NPIL_10391 [Nephila pilipes]|uniref:Uncharacterized protein n=1 Tax=Nephila pilipes TaxID=299642 RepID=A0A8X6UHB2_NEPPI|nr:hypothetical protein NPIL_10391 [Nephila pilipes]